MRRWSVIILPVAAGMLAWSAAAEMGRAQDPGEDSQAVRKIIERIKKAANHSWEEIPWVGSLPEARQLSAKEKRPVFLFTHEGNIRSGRC